MKAGLPGAQPRFVAVQLLLWGAYAVLRFSASLPAISEDERAIMAVAAAVRAATGLLISSVAWPLLARRADPRFRSAWLVAGVVALAAGVAWMFLDRALLVTVAAVFGVPIPWHRFPRGVDVEYLVAMLAWCAGAVALLWWAHGRRLQEQLLRRELETQEARHHALVAQLNPHFLFNALNTIRSLAAEDPARTRDALTRLAALLRRVLAFDDTSSTTLEQELDHVRDYLAIEQARFEDGLRVCIEVAPDAGGILVPPLILQPLVENAVRHGEPAMDGIRGVRIHAAFQRGQLVVEVENTGRLAPAAANTGLGIRLTRSRLERMYGSAQRLELANRGGCVMATIVLERPLQSPRAADAADADGGGA